MADFWGDPQCEATLYTHKEYAFWRQQATDARCHFAGVKQESGKILCDRHAPMELRNLVDYTEEDGSHRTYSKDEIEAVVKAERYRPEVA